MTLLQGFEQPGRQNTFSVAIVRNQVQVILLGFFLGHPLEGFFNLRKHHTGGGGGGFICVKYQNPIDTTVLTLILVYDESEELTSPKRIQG